MRPYHSQVFKRMQETISRFGYHTFWNLPWICIFLLKVKTPSKSDWGCVWIRNYSACGNSSCNIVAKRANSLRVIQVGSPLKSSLYSGVLKWRTARIFNTRSSMTSWDRYILWGLILIQEEHTNQFEYNRTWRSLSSALPVARSFSA